MTFPDILKELKVKADQRIVEIPDVGRGDLATWLRLLDFKVGAEVGVAGGGYLQKLCKENPQMKFYAIDPWAAYKGYTDYKHQRTINGLFKEFWKRMEPYRNFEPIRKFSMDAAAQFLDVSLDFVYIDANHSEPYITQDIVEWSKKVRPGGIVAGHDYVGMESKNWPVKVAIEKYCEVNSIAPLYILGSSEYTPGDDRTRDISRSWMFIKQ